MRNSKRKTWNKACIKCIVKSILIKSTFFRKMYITNDLKKKKEEIEIRVRHRKTNITKLIKQSKAKQFNNLLNHAKIFTRSLI